MSIKIFCDIADLKIIKKFNKKKLVKGFTTNPSLMRKAGAKNYENYCKKIIKITNKPVSFEVFADNSKSMIAQGIQINTWGKNVYVKVPVINSKGKFMGKVINTLNKNNIKLNLMNSSLIFLINNFGKHINLKSIFKLLSTVLSLGNSSKIFSSSIIHLSIII